MNNCKLCGLYRYSLKNKIQGRGNKVNPKIILIGEAPGPDESKVGIPFVGRAGRKLDQMIKPALENNDVYITNMVKCFPPLSTTYPEKSFRVPKDTEIEYCKPFLMQELKELTKQEHLPIIMTLGNVALKGLIGNHKGITKEVGIEKEYIITPAYYPLKVVFKLIPNFHPSLIVRNANYKDRFIEVFNKAYENCK